MKNKKKNDSNKLTVKRKALVIEKGKMRVTPDEPQTEEQSSKEKGQRNTYSRKMRDLFNVKILEKVAKIGFKFLEGINRAIIPAQVTLLATSIQLMGIIRPVVVAYLDFAGLKGWYIIDGQHLYFALLRLNMDIPYVEIEIKNEEELVKKTALLNSSSKSWQLKDYIQIWSFIRPDYKKLSYYFNQYDLEVQTIASILSGRNAGSGGVNSVIKNGTFKVKNEDRAVQILDFVTDVLNIVPRMDRISNKFFVGAYVEYVTQNFTTYNHTRFCNYLKKNSEKLTFVNGDKDNIFNFFNECN
jgi:hypothetical protein